MLQYLLARRDRARTISWSFINQAFSSSTNFGLSILGGRVLGPEGLGKIFLAFSIYLIASALQRTLLNEPLSVISASLSHDARKQSARSGLTMSLIAGLLATGVVAVAGIIVPGFVGRALVLISVWLLPAMLQDFWRHLLFRDQKAFAAARNDAVWLVFMALTLPAAITLRTDWAVLGCWGFGALIAACYGFSQVRVRPASPKEAWTWWRAEAWPFGRWNSGAELVGSVGGYSVPVILSAVLGAASLGGLRAAETVFAPLTLIGPALQLPGLPAVSRAHMRSPRSGRRVAFVLSAIAIGMTLGFVVIMLLGGWRVLPLIFGSVFAQYRNLIVPIGLAQVCLAANSGAYVLLKARKQGSALLLGRLIGTSSAVALISFLAWRYGLLGAAWGFAGGALTTTAAIAGFALWPPFAKGDGSNDSLPGTS